MKFKFETFNVRENKFKYLKKKLNRKSNPINFIKTLVQNPTEICFQIFLQFLINYNPFVKLIFIKFCIYINLCLNPT